MGEVDEEAGEFWVDNPFLIAARGGNLSGFEENRTFVNVGGETFLDATYATPASIDSDSRSSVVADFDGDGAPDLLVGSAGGGALRLFLGSRTNTSHRVRLELEGTDSNRAAIGTRVELTVANRRIVRDAFPANGFMGQSPPDLLIGVGTADTIDQLTVRWPNGKTQTFRDLLVDVTIAVTENQHAITTMPLGRK